MYLILFIIIYIVFIMFAGKVENKVENNHFRKIYYKDQIVLKHKKIPLYKIGGL